MTYKCEANCSIMSKAISTTNIHGYIGTTVNYCRPYVAQAFNYVYFVDPSSVASFELGTIDYPFKVMESPPKEIFNFMFEKTTNFTVNHMRGTSMKLYYGVMPIVLVNIDTYTLTNYGDQSLKKPHVYITGHEYIWPGSSFFSISEEYYALDMRVSRGDMASQEASTFFLKFNVFRGNLNIIGLDF
jgi:hypothetical protein